MSLVQNLSDNPIPSAPSRWTTANGTSAPMAFQVFLGVAAAVTTAMPSATSQVAAHFVEYPFVAGESYTFEIDAAYTGSPRARMRLRWRDADNGNIGSEVQLPSVPVSATAYTRLSATTVAPPNAVRMVVYVEARTGSDGVYDPAGGELLAITRASANRGAAGLGAYRDGDSPGWAWLGTPGLSASHGPAGTYQPEAQLRLPAVGRVDWVDVVLGYSEATPTRAIVHETIDGPPQLVVRSAGAARGRLQLLVRAETAGGAAATRAAAVAASLRSGTIHELTPERSGAAPLWGRSFVAAGGTVAATLDPQTRRAWLVDFDWIAL